MKNFSVPEAKKNLFVPCGVIGGNAIRQEAVFSIGGAIGQAYSEAQVCTQTRKCFCIKLLKNFEDVLESDSKFDFGHSIRYGNMVTYNMVRIIYGFNVQLVEKSIANYSAFLFGEVKKKEVLKVFCEIFLVNNQKDWLAQERTLFLTWLLNFRLDWGHVCIWRLLTATNNSDPRILLWIRVLCSDFHFSRWNSERLFRRLHKYYLLLPVNNWGVFQRNCYCAPTKGRKKFSCRIEYTIILEYNLTRGLGFGRLHI